MAEKYIVTALWDDDAQVWVATSDDIPGLVTEATTLDALLARVVAVAPELLEDNAHLLDREHLPGDTIDVHIVSELRLHGTAAE
jgi:predicted RNase H-like HicB family nuclease